MAKKGYSQSIRMQDTEGVKVTVLLAESKTGLLNVDAWYGSDTAPAAVAHSLMLAAKTLCDHPYVRDTLELAITFSEAKLVDAGYATFPEGEAIPSDDLPF